MKDLKGFEEYYSISENGKIFSKRSNKFLKLNYKKNEYVYVELNVNSKTTYHRVHRLVAFTYIDNPENKEYVNHKDGNKSNNHVDNLEWVTPSENNLHMFSELGVRNHFQTNHPFKGVIGKKHFLSKKVKQLTKLGQLVKIWDCITDIERAGIAKASDISRVCKGKRFTTGGYRWSYYNE